MGGVEPLISVGRIVRPHGIRGEVKVAPLTEWPERFQEFRSIYVEPEGENGEWMEIERARVQGRRIILKLSGIDDRDRADSIRGFILKVDKETCPPLPEGQYYISDLIGMRVVTMAGEEIGLLVDVLNMPSQDVYVVEADGREILIPGVKAFIKRVDVENKMMIIETIPGLLE